tara:strand:+ start:111 stop:713 length:603 start_codon:yes stop_codon:yes gene_type:complete
MATYQDSRYNIALPSGSGGAITLIKTVTASSDSTINFVNGTSDVVLDNTYRTYIFKFINIHPATNDVQFQVNFRDGSTAYDATKTSTFFYSYNNEGDSATALSYDGGSDLAQSTGVQTIVLGQGNGNDESASGEMYLFNPSSTTFVKHFMTRISFYQHNNYAFDTFTAGYCNVTAAIDAVQFSMSSGNIDAGTIKLYGIT